MTDIEVVQMLSQTARKYDRSLELDLDNLTLEEVVIKLENPNIQEWQTDAFIRHLVKEENAAHVFTNPKFITALTRHLLIIKPYMSLILEFTFHPNSQCQKELVNLCKLLLDELKTDELSHIFSSFHSRFGLTTLLKSETWDDRFVVTLNKYNIGEEAGMRREVLLLAMEDGHKLLTSVLKCAEDSSGKVKTCSGLLSEVSPLARLITDSDMFLLTSQLLNMIYCNELKENQQNLFSLQLSLCQSMPDVCLKVCENILKHVVENFKVSVPSQLVDYTSHLENTIEILSDSLDANLRIKISLAFGYFINSLSTVSSPSERQLLMKEKGMRIVEKMRGKEIGSEHFLNRDNYSFFRDNDKAELLREKILQSYLKSTHDMNLDGVKGQLFGSFCCLLSRDWNHICNSELSDLLPAIITTAMKLNESQVHFYSALRSLCSEFKLSWANLFHLIR